MFDGKTCMRSAKCEGCPLAAYWQEEAGSAWESVAGRVAGEPGTGGILLIARSPGSDEVARNRPMVGSWGAEVVTALKTLGLKRSDVSWTNAVACRFPRDDRKWFESWRRRANKKRIKDGLLPWGTAEEACWPRLEQEVAAHANVVTFGVDALRAVGVDPAMRVGAPTLDDFAGFPTTTGALSDGSTRRLMATVMDFQRDAAQNPLLLSDLRKALAVWSGRVSWADPQSVVQPSAADLEAWLWSAPPNEPVVFDVETSAYFTRTAPTPDEIEEGIEVEDTRVFDGRKDPLRMIGFYWGGKAYKVHFIPVGGIGAKFTDFDGGEYCRPYTPDEEAAVRRVCATWLQSERRKIGHNARVYDRLVCETAFGVTPHAVIDTHPLDKLADSDRRHGLSSLARRYTFVGPWKAEHAATDARSDAELGLYNGRDLKVNAVVEPWVRRAAVAREQAHLEGTYGRLQDVCVDMHKMGLRFSEHKRQLACGAADRKIADALRVINDIAPKKFGKNEVDPINPNSAHQLRRLLFDVWDLTPREFTDGGEPSTGDDVLRWFILSRTTPEHVVAFLTALRKLRKFRKVRGTYLDAWAPRNGLSQQFDPVGDPDGFYLHTDYNPCGTVGWRFSSRNPNVQNVSSNKYKDDLIGKWCLRDLFEAPPGYCFIGSDMDQLELRLCAALAECDPLIDAFELGEIDTHNLSGQIIYGPSYYDCDGAPKDHRKKGEGKFKERRTLVKRMVYLMIYDGSAPTMRDILAEDESEDEHGNPVFTYKDLRVDAVDAMKRKWMRGFGQIKSWHHSITDEVRRQGYLAEPVWGLRRYFWSTSTPNEMFNFKVQAGGGAIVHQAMFNVLRDLVPFDFARGTGLVQQVHDSLMFQVEGSAKDARVVALTRDIEEAMKIRVPGLRMTFTAEAKCGQTWSDT